MQTFAGGQGDVLLSYESEAIAAEKAGIPVQYIVPSQTILIQTPIAVLSKSSHSQQAQAFVNWLWTPAAQTIWAQKGYRPVLASVLATYASKFPTPPQLFTIAYLGGWTSVKKTFFDPSTGSVTKIDQAFAAPVRAALPFFQVSAPTAAESCGIGSQVHLSLPLAASKPRTSPLG